jgi:hypothetical protein
MHGNRQSASNKNKLPLVVFLSSALGLPVLALGGSSGWINCHCLSLISLNSFSRPPLCKGKSITKVSFDEMSSEAKGTLAVAHSVVF